MKPNVLLATSIGLGKEYTLDFLPRVLADLESLGDVLITIDSNVEVSFNALNLMGSNVTVNTLTKGRMADDTIRAGRISRVRQDATAYFKAHPEYTHLYFHDCDMIPPNNIIAKLLETREDFVGALYIMRGQTTPSLAMLGEKGGTYADMSVLDIGSESTLNVYAVGTGSMLLSRVVCDAIDFRNPSFFKDELQLGEDFQFCADWKELDPKNTVKCLLLPKGIWHVDGEKSARCNVAEEQMTARYIGLSAQVRTMHGIWDTNKWRTIGDYEASMLGVSFETKVQRALVVETASTSSVMSRKGNE